MLVSGIKSKPTYEPLRADTRGLYHLMLARGPGGVALLRVLGELQSSAPELLKTTRVLFVGDALRTAADTPGDATSDPSDMVAPFKEFAPAAFSMFDDTPELLAEFRALLEQSLMGTRLYVAGPESFIGLALRVALEFNLNKDEIRAEEIGTLARRVYCVHCQATTENVRTNIVRCAKCQCWLLVRDHYSRRLAAYMGVMADAEAPGELPPLRELYT
jgi:hypothetical protein